ncbi:MAG: hypothetical protein RLZZ361_884 [Cyanobacteriota bacterium]
MPKEIKQTLPITSTPTEQTKPPKKESAKKVHPGKVTSNARETGVNLANTPTRSNSSTPPNIKQYSTKKFKKLANWVLRNPYEEIENIFKIPYEYKAKLFKALEEINLDPELLAIIKFEYELHHNKHDEAAKFLILNCGVFSISRPKDNQGKKPQVSFLEGNLFNIQENSGLKQLDSSKVKDYIQKNSETLIKESGLFALMLLASRYNILKAKETLIYKLTQCKEGKLALQDPVYQDLESSIRYNPSIELLDKNRHLNYVLEKLRVLNGKETDVDIKELLNASINNLSPSKEEVTETLLI